MLPGLPVLPVLVILGCASFCQFQHGKLSCLVVLAKIEPVDKLVCDMHPYPCPVFTWSRQIEMGCKSGCILLCATARCYI